MRDTITVRRRALAVLAAAVALVGLSAAPSSAGQFRMTAWNYAGTYDYRLSAYTSDGSDGYGDARWHADGEVLESCDLRRDGRFVRAEASFSDTDRPVTRLVQVVDQNGSAAGCSSTDLDLPERWPVKLRVCVQDLGCSRWISTRA